MNVFVLRKRTLQVLIGVALTCGALALAGCGGDEEEAAVVQPPPPPPPPPPPGNQAPTIAGTPATTVMQGNAYSFTPTAADPDANTTLTFSVANLPGWAAFNTSTGRVSGTPSAANVGTYNNITITVSDGTANASLAPFSIQVVAVATGSATLSWNPPTQNTDGSPLANLSGYKVYWGTSQGNYTNSVTIGANLSTYVVEPLTPATYFFAVTALSSVGAESTYSNSASKQVL